MEHYFEEEDVKIKPLWGRFFPMIAGLFLAAYAPAQGAGTEKITVLNPAIANTVAKRMPLSPRLDSLDGKTLYIVNINWGDGAAIIYEEIQAWFAKNMPSIKTVIKRKKGDYSQDDPELWKEIAENGQAAIVGISS